MSIGTFLFKLYKSKQKSVDSARFGKFNVKMRKGNKSRSLNLSVLPPYRSVFWLHCLRANYITGIWKRYIVRNPEIFESQNCGWPAAGRTQWVEA